MPAVLKEITDKYQPEGFFGNRWAGSGMCYCQTCRTKFRAATGLELPTSNDPQEPRRKAYIAWNADMRWKQFTLWNDTVRAAKKDCFFSPNGGLNEPDKVMHPLIAVDRQGRSGTTPVWMMGKYARQTRAYMQNLPVCGIVNIGVEDDNRWKDSVQTGPELAAWTHAGIAQGMRPWFVKFNARVFDTRWVAPRRKSSSGITPMTNTCETQWLLPGSDRGAHSVRDGGRPPDGARPAGALSRAGAGRCGGDVGQAVPADPRFRDGGRAHRGDGRNLAL
jgi:hypothetical protein